MASGWASALRYMGCYVLLQYLCSLYSISEAYLGDSRGPDQGTSVLHNGKEMIKSLSPLICCMKHDILDASLGGSGFSDLDHEFLIRRISSSNSLLLQPVHGTTFLPQICQAHKHCVASCVGPCMSSICRPSLSAWYRLWQTSQSAHSVPCFFSGANISCSVSSLFHKSG